MKDGKIRCVGEGYYRVVMDDGKLFTIVHYFKLHWRVFASNESDPDARMPGEFKTVKDAKQAIIDDFSKREYADYKMVWYGTKWGLEWDEEDNKPSSVWRGQKPEGWKYDFLKPSWLAS
jgi:hypothetical protein